MATLYITEFVGQGTDLNAHEMASPLWPQNSTQTVSVGATSASCSAFQTATMLVRLHSDTTCSYILGVSPVASATSPRLAQNQTEYHVVPANASWKVACITNS